MDNLQFLTFTNVLLILVIDFMVFFSLKLDTVPATGKSLYPFVQIDILTTLSLNVNSEMRTHRVFVESFMKVSCYGGGVF